MLKLVKLSDVSEKRIFKMSTPEIKVKLYVGNISWHSTDADVLEHFKEFGDVRSAQIVTDKETGRSKGFGFVEMGTPKEAEAALAADGTQLNGRVINVSFARPKSEKR